MVKRPAAGFWFKGRDNKMASYPYGEKSPIYSGNAYDIFARDFLVWFFQDEKIKENLKLSWPSFDQHWNSKILTVRFKNFQVENFRDLLKTFEVFEIHVFDPGLKTFEVFVNNSRFKNFRDFLHQIFTNFWYFCRLNKYETSIFQTMVIRQPFSLKYFSF